MLLKDTVRQMKGVRITGSLFTDIDIRPGLRDNVRFQKHSERSKELQNLARRTVKGNAATLRVILGGLASLRFLPSALGRRRMRKP